MKLTMFTNHRMASPPKRSVAWRVLLLIFLWNLPLGTCKAQTPSLLQSDGKIYNSGVLKIRGDAAIIQDTIGGVVRYERDRLADSQLVAHLTYRDLHFEGRSIKKVIDPSEPVIADNLFWSIDTNVVVDLSPATFIQANRTVVHDGYINPGLRYGRFVLGGTTNQDVSGRGTIPVLELNNLAGATITRSGGLLVFERLDLQRGLLSNSGADNLDISQNGWIWRDDSGSIAQEPKWTVRLNLRYYGDSLMLGGAEMVRAPTAIGNLVQDDTSGLMLPYSIFVNDSMILRGHIYTEQDSARRWELYYTNTYNPWYDGLWPEVIGTMVRTNLVDGQPMMMNNEHATIFFANATERGDVEQYAVRNMPRTIPPPLSDITFKVNRFLQLEPRSAVGDKIADSTYTMTFGYSWRALERLGREGQAFNETIIPLRGQESQLVLMRYDGISYNPYGFSALPTNTNTPSPAGIWRYSTAGLVRASGDFAIGLSTGPIWKLNALLYLEGAVRTYGENFTPIMSNDLAVAGLVPTVAPNIFPYSLDPDRLVDTALTISDSVVDWVTVEFRNSPTASGPPLLIETLLLLVDGRMVDPQTYQPRVISGIDQGYYYLEVRHRNHLSIITEDSILVARSEINRVVDFTGGVAILGGAASQKLIGTSSGRRWFGLIAGEVTASDEILRDDYNLVWNNRNAEGYLVHDTNLNGIVTTRDLNVTWNNRERLSVAPR